MPLENRAMTKSLAVASARLAIAEMMLSGTASAVDMYYFEADIAEAADQLGFRLWAGETMLDVPHPDAKDFNQGFHEMDRLLELESDLITPMIAPHAPYSLMPENIRRCHDYALSKDIPWTMHLSEMPFEIKAFREKYSMSPFAFLDKAGLLSDSLIAAHMLLPQEGDLDILSERKVLVAHCPLSNSKIAKGGAPIPEMIDKGIICTLGTDGPASGNTLDIYTQMKLYAVLQKNRLSNRAACRCEDVLPLATRNAGAMLKAPIGQIRTGYQADIQVLLLDRVSMIPCHDPYSVAVYSASAADVKDLYVRGKQTVKDHGLIIADLSALKEDFIRESHDFASMAEDLL